MTKGRLEAFSDGVIAIIITIMVLELKTPHGHTLDALTPLVPTFCAYALSFVFVGIYWNNHHHMLHLATGVSGGVLWANLHLLFWLSLVPFVTGWMGEAFEAVPVAAYGVVLLMSGVAYAILQRTIIAVQGKDGPLARATGKQRKELFSTVCYTAAIPLAFVDHRVSALLFVAVAAAWLVPDRRLEHAATHSR